MRRVDPCIIGSQKSTSNIDSKWISKIGSNNTLLINQVS